MILAIEPINKFTKQCYDLVERVKKLRASILKELSNLTKNISSILLIKTFKSRYRSFLL